MKVYFAYLFAFFVVHHYSIFAQHTEQLIPYRKGDKWGLCTIDKKIIVVPMYDEPLLMQRDSSVFDGKILYYASIKVNDKYGAINEKGELFIPAEHQQPIYLRQGFFSFQMPYDENLNDPKNKNKEKYAIYNYKNKKIFSSKFMPGIPREFQNGLLAVSLIKDTKTYVGMLGFIDYEGKTIIPFMYDGNHPMSDYHFENGYALVAKNNKMGIIDKNNKIIFPFTLEAVPSHHKLDENGNIIISLFDGKEMIIDTKGKVLSKKNANIDPIEIKIPNSTNLIKGIAKQITPYQTLSYMIVDKDKKRISKNDYDDISEFKNGVAIAKNVKDAYTKNGVIDENDNQILPLIYNNIHDWDKDYYLLQDTEDRIGLFNTKTKKIEIPCKYSACNSYMLKNGTIMMQKRENNKTINVLVNQKGEEVRTLSEYDLISNGYNNELKVNNYFPAKKGDKKTVLDSNMKEIVPFFEDIEGIYINGERFISAKKNGLWGVLTFNNEILVPFEYEKIGDYAIDWKYIFETTKNGKTLFIKIPEKAGEKVVEYTE